MGAGPHYGNDNSQHYLKQVDQERGRTKAIWISVVHSDDTPLSLSLSLSLSVSLFLKVSCLLFFGKIVFESSGAREVPRDGLHVCFAPGKGGKANRSGSMIGDCAVRKIDRVLQKGWKKVHLFKKPSWNAEPDPINVVGSL